MSLYTAIILSRDPVDVVIPGVQVLARVQTVTNVAQMNAARLDAIEHVTTPYCFYLDDDDELPDDYSSVLEECRAAGVAMAYTNELVRRADGDFVSKARPYDAAEHARNAMFVHHLVLMQTDKAKEAALAAPRGDYWPEMTLYSLLARHGAAHIDRLGYIWNKGSTGLHTWPRMLAAQNSSVAWFNRRRTS